MRSLSWRARRSRHHHYAASTAHSAQRAPHRFPGHVASLAARRRRSEGAQDRVGESLRVTGRKFFAKDDSTQVEGSADEVLGDLEVGVRRDFPRSIARRSIPSPACRLGFRNRAQHARRFSGRLVARQPLVHQIDRLVEGTVPIPHNKTVCFCSIAATHVPADTPPEPVRECTTASGRRVVKANAKYRMPGIAVLDGLGERLRRGQNRSCGVWQRCDKHELVDLAPLIAAWFNWSVVDLEPPACRKYGIAGSSRGTLQSAPDTEQRTSAVTWTASQPVWRQTTARSGHMRVNRILACARTSSWGAGAASFRRVYRTRWPSKTRAPHRTGPHARARRQRHPTGAA